MMYSLVLSGVVDHVATVSAVAVFDAIARFCPIPVPRIIRTRALFQSSTVQLLLLSVRVVAVADVALPRSPLIRIVLMSELARLSTAYCWLSSVNSVHLRSLSA